MKKKRYLIALGVLLPLSIIAVTLGLKYFPLNKVVSIPSSSEKEFLNSQKIHAQAPNSLCFDFEVDPGKPTPDGFYKGIAHSGLFSAKAFGQNSFGAAIERTAREIGVENLKEVSLSTWVYVFPTTKEVNATFVLAASNELGVNICWKGVGLSGTGIPCGKWFKISGKLDLSEVQFKPEYKLKIYFWNNSPTDILVDDYYMVFGSQPDRRGDTVFVDMTKETSFNPRLNFPPFPTVSLERVHGWKKMKEISPSDKIISGDFLNDQERLEEILVVHKGLKPFFLSFCASSTEIRKIPFHTPSSALPFFTSGNIWKGKFLAAQGEQLLMASENGMMLGKFTNSKGPCASESEIIFNIVWQSFDKKLSGIYMKDNQWVFPGDFNKDGISELLLLMDHGYWKILQFDQAKKDSWEILAEGDRNPVREWDRSVFEIGLSVDHFLADIGQDVILSVVKNKQTGKSDYSLRWYHSSGGKFESKYPEKSEYFGKTIGLDTLKPTDRFFTSASESGQGRMVLRYNRDWRFDLKQLTFNDTAFQIQANVDFHGYDKDHNPKYYESLRIIPGKYTVQGNTTYFILGSNKEETTELPDVMELYSFPQK